MDSKYLVFKQMPYAGKTKKWQVHSRRRGDLLGIIRWYGPWRQYCFSPTPGTTFNRGCMEDICEFITKQMELWRAAK